MRKALGPKRSNVGRYYRSIGLGFKTPLEAITGTYIDKKCPFTGDVSIRGRILSGVVASNKMKNTITIRRYVFSPIYAVKSRRETKLAMTKKSVGVEPCRDSVVSFLGRSMLTS